MKILVCGDIGLDCNYIIKGNTEEELIKNATEHIWELHAINPKEMTTEMKVRIKENIKDSQSQTTYDNQP
jgi:predicted small metal-binding protein